MDNLKQLCECYVVKSPLSIGIEVLEFWPVLVLVLVLKISFNQELVLVLVLILVSRSHPLPGVACLGLQTPRGV